jgi:MFS family permease
MPADKKNNNKNRGRLLILYFLGLLLAVSVALPAYIQSNFLNQFIGIKTVSLFFVVANLLTVVAILFFPHLIKKLTNYFLTQAVLILYAVSLLGLSLSAGATVALLSLIIFSITSNLIWINMDIMVENFSVDASTGRTRTIYFTFINAGWILSPLFSVYLIGKGEYNLTFLVAGFLVIPFFLIFLNQAKKLKDKIKYQKETLLATIKRTWERKNLRGIFFIALLLQLFYSSAVIYIPLHLFQDLKMSWEILGPIFSFMLIPFILLEIPAGILADKYLGEKELLFTGFAILAISLFLFYYIKTPTVWIWAAVLFASRVGAALVEAMRETFFFKIVDAKDVGCINVFRTTGPLAYVLGSTLAIITLTFFSLNYLFLVLAIIMLSGFVFTASLKDTK